MLGSSSFILRYSTKSLRASVKYAYFKVKLSSINDVDKCAVAKDIIRHMALIIFITLQDGRYILSGGKICK